jgi:hypothetical protein
LVAPPLAAKIQRSIGPALPAIAACTSAVVTAVGDHRKRPADGRCDLGWRRDGVPCSSGSSGGNVSKIGSAGRFAMTIELRQLLEKQWAEHLRLEKKSRMAPGMSAGRIRPADSHGLRRSGIRQFVRAGLSQSVAMDLSGPLTADVFRRYDIVSNADIGEAAVKLDAAAGQSTPASEKRTAKVSKFARR